MLKGDADRIREDLLVEYYSDTEVPRLQGMGYKGLRTDRWKYVRYVELKGIDELYDLTADPFEMNNLLPDRAPAGVLEDLSSRLEAHLWRAPGAQAR